MAGCAAAIMQHGGSGRFSSDRTIRDTRRDIWFRDHGAARRDTATITQ
jgi:glucan phosphorylase